MSDRDAEWREFGLREKVQGIRDADIRDRWRLAISLQAEKEPRGQEELASRDDAKMQIAGKIVSA